ncbi:acyl-CoA dehydrogenase family protein [Sorangium sp. So ce124]|uniref:acyl-CoA dehydrogenase family protein n=1 Tax=Sorangium sp. So ce124 TaxID=3133280 RepID=UPI003F6148D2
MNLEQSSIRVAVMKAPGRISPAANAPSLEALVSTARELVPCLREQAQQTEIERRVSEETNQLFHRAGFYRLMQPARYGGYEYGFTALLDVISEIGRGCTSSAWACSLGAIHQWLLGLFPGQAQDDVWRESPRAIMCGSYSPVAAAHAVDGGYLIQGKWRFASNVDNSQWAVLGVQFPREDDATPNAGFLLVPRSDWSIEDDWHVAGQAGTGSKTVVLDKPTFVPGHRKLTFAEAASGAPPGAAVNPNRIYSISFLSAIPVCLVAPLLGTAQGAIDAFIDLCEDRVTRGGIGGAGARLSQFAHVQSRLADAAAAVDAARLVLDRDITEVELTAAQGRSVSVEKRIRNRRGHAYAAKLSHSAIDALFSCVGGSSLALAQPIQRMWRDGNAIAQHITLNWDAVSTMVGQHMMGLEPKGAY